MDNWIEREARQREQLRTSAPQIWQEILTAVEDTCNSYNRHHSDKGNAKFQPQNGHSVLVEVTHQSLKGQIMDMKRRVRITFDGATSITATVDEHTLPPAAVEADAEHCFLTVGKKEISIEQFCKYMLSDAFFTEKIPQLPGSPKPKIGPWS